MPDNVSDYIENELDDLRAQYNILRDIYIERSQLYGSIIRMMLKDGLDEVVFDRPDLQLSSKYILKFTPGDNNTLVLQLLPNLNYKEPENE